jgi:hypothetical protein
MSDFLLGIAIGLVVGWNLLPQPAWVKNSWGWAWGKAKKLQNDEATTTDDSANT